MWWSTCPKMSRSFENLVYDSHFFLWLNSIFCNLWDHHIWFHRIESTCRRSGYKHIHSCAQVDRYRERDEWRAGNQIKSPRDKINSAAHQKNKFWLENQNLAYALQIISRLWLFWWRCRRRRSLLMMMTRHTSQSSSSSSLSWPITYYYSIHTPHLPNSESPRRVLIFAIF